MINYRMVIDKLILHDFGVFAGYQEAVVTPASKDAPVILIGGLNGSGKTTFLDALQLCLFGPIARCSNYSGQNYHEYLASCINKQAAQAEASLGLSFRHTVNGKEVSYLIRRSWRRTRKNHVRETFTVDIDHMPAKRVADDWLQHIEQIMPANIAHLFFFDGEQAEEYAVAERSSSLIKTAILSLLGLDLVDKTIKDLQVLERKTAVKGESKEFQSEIARLEGEIAKYRGGGAEIERLAQELASVQSHKVDASRRRIATLEEKYRKAGGDLYERRSEIEQAAAKVRQELDQSEASLRKHAEGCLPFALVAGLVKSLEARDVHERELVKSQASLSGLEKVRASLLEWLKQRQADQAATDLVDSFLASEIEGARTAVAEGARNPLDDHVRLALHSLSHEKIGQAVAAANTEIETHRELMHRAKEADLELASIPQPDELKEISEEREASRKQLAEGEKMLAEIKAKMEAAEREAARLEEQLASHYAQATEQKVQEEEKQRLLTHSSRGRETLEGFRRLVVHRHISRIQTLVLESYQSLLRKTSLVNEMKIDPDTFQVELQDAEKRPVPADRLSAGERQLLAVSLLWGMAKASGRPLPTAIDTPLGRLDASHRRHLVERYFPHASHQVLLLSTDQELHGKYLEDLKGSIGRSYLLEYDDATGSTKIREGYLS